MPSFRCPGQDSRFWKPEDIAEIPCPKCGHVTEFWKDEPKLRCRGCGSVVVNPKMDLGCAKWCKFAEQCLGAQATVNEDTSVRDQLLDEMKRVFGDDRARIDHALQVLEHAEDILEDVGGDPLVVKAAAILHDIGIPEAERKHGSSAGKYQEMEGPPIARKILDKVGITGPRVAQICDIVGDHHSAKGAASTEFNIIWDADHLVNMHEEYATKSPEKLQAFVEAMFRTRLGRTLAAAKLREMGANA